MEAYFVAILRDHAPFGDLRLSLASIFCRYLSGQIIATSNEVTYFNDVVVFQRLVPAKFACPNACFPCVRAVGGSNFVSGTSCPHAAGLAGLGQVTG